MNDRLRILIVAANPKDMHRLDLREELTQLRNGMKDNQDIGNAEVLVEWAARAHDLQSAVRKNRPHIVHFAGHGSHEGIWLEDDEGNSRLLSKETLPLILSASPDLRLVVLNACATAPQIEALKRSVEFVVGTQCSVRDSVALDFTTHFYRGLAGGQKVRDAFWHAQERVGTHVHEQLDRYELFVRDGVDESKPLIPPFVQEIAITHIKNLTTETFELANTFNEGVGDMSTHQAGNQKKEASYSGDNVNTKSFRLGNTINRSK